MKTLGLKPEDVPHTYGGFHPEHSGAQRRLKEAFESIGRGADTSGVVLEAAPEGQRQSRSGSMVVAPRSERHIHSHDVS
jgi:hypothetical protein